MSKKIKNLVMPELSGTMPIPTKKRGRPKKENSEQKFTDSDLREQKARAIVVQHFMESVKKFPSLKEEPKKRRGRPKKNEPKNAFIPVDAFNPLDPDYDELYVDNMPKKKMGRPRKNPVVPAPKKKMGRPRKNPVVPAPKKKSGRPTKNPVVPAPKPLFEKKCQNCGAEFQSKLNRNKFCSVKCRNKDFYEKNYKRKDTKITVTEKKPLENFTKRTVIVGESNQKETLALEFSNQRVEALKHDNKKLLELNNEKIIENSKLKSEIMNLKSELELNNEVVRKPYHLTNIIFMIIYLVVGIAIGIAFMFSLANN